MNATEPVLRTVRIPARTAHDGRSVATITLLWSCPTCGGPRGDIVPAISFDGSMRLHCDGWTNPCGHTDYYAAVRVEAGIDSPTHHRPKTNP